MVDQRIEKPQLSPEMPVAPEQEKAPESGQEQVPEKKPEQSAEAQQQPVSQDAGAGAQDVEAVPMETKSENLKLIEQILSSNISEIYAELPDNRKAEFRKKGEETATQIEKLMKSAKVNVIKVVELIKGWLSLLPGINKYFLDQESKIKADQILDLKKDQ